MSSWLEVQRHTERPVSAERETALYLRSYLLMRVLIGAIGILLPIVLIVGDQVLGDTGALTRGSLSAYYYSGGRDFFVGVLCATGVFLVTYKVIERNLDNTLSTLAGLAVVGVALFPTGRGDAAVLLTPLQDRLGESAVEAVHYICAFVFIGSLAVICVVFGVREGNRLPHGRRSPGWWRNFHWACAGLIVVAIAFLGLSKLVGGIANDLLITEVVAVWSFGLSWLAKGMEWEILRGTRRATPGDGRQPPPLDDDAGVAVPGRPLDPSGSPTSRPV